MFLFEKETPYGRFTIRNYIKGDEAHILELFHTVFGHKKSLEHWRWEFLGNPWGTYITLGFMDGSLISQCAGVPAELYYRGRVIKALQVVDCMCHPKYRAIPIMKKGAFVLTVETFFKEFTGCEKAHYVFGFPSARHHRLGALLLGYKKLNPIREVEFRLPSKARLNRYRFLYRLKEISADEVSLLRELIDRWALADAERLGFCVFKSWRYVKWRFVEKPNGNYRFFVLYTLLGKPVSIAILGLYRGRIILLDLLNVKYLNAVLHLLFMKLQSPIRFWLPEGSWVLKDIDSACVSVGDPEIKAVPSGIVFCKDVFASESVHLEFFYTMGDSDLF